MNAPVQLPNLVLERAIVILKDTMKNWDNEEIEVEVDWSVGPLATALEHALKGEYLEKVEMHIQETFSDSLMFHRDEMMDQILDHAMRELEREFVEGEDYDADEIREALDEKIKNYEVGDEPYIDLQVTNEARINVHMADSDLGNVGNLFAIYRLLGLHISRALDTVYKTSAVDCLVQYFASSSVPEDFLPEANPDPELKDGGNPLDVLAAKLQEVIGEHLSEYRHYEIGFTLKLSHDDLIRISRAAETQEKLDLLIDNMAVFTHDFTNGAGDYDYTDREVRLPLDLLKSLNVRCFNDRGYGGYGLEETYDHWPCKSNTRVVNHVQPQHEAGALLRAQYERDMAAALVALDEVAVRGLWTDYALATGKLPQLLPSERMGTLLTTHFAALAKNKPDAVAFMKMLVNEGAEVNLAPGVDKATHQPIDFTETLEYRQANFQTQAEVGDHDLVVDLLEMGAKFCLHGRLDEVMEPEGWRALIADLVSRNPHASEVPARISRPGL